MNELVKIKDDAENQLRGVLFYCIKLIGMNPKKLIQEDMTIIMDYLSRNFENFPISKIQIAFELGVKGDLDINLDHYQSFNSMYVSNVILAYKRYLAHNIKIKPMVEPKPSPQLTYDQIANEAAKVFRLYRDGGDLSQVNWTVIYEYYKSKCLISFNKDSVVKFEKKVKKEIESELKELNNAGKLGGNLIYALESPMIFHCECRKRAVIEYFKSII